MFVQISDSRQVNLFQITDMVNYLMGDVPMLRIFFSSGETMVIRNGDISLVQNSVKEFNDAITAVKDQMAKEQ